MADDKKINHRRHPDESPADSRHDRKHGHDCSPKGRAPEPRSPKAHPRQRALNHADDERALDRRAGDGTKPFQDSHFIAVAERRVVENLLQNVAAVAQEIEHRVEHDEEVEQKSGGAAVSWVAPPTR